MPVPIGIRGERRAICCGLLWRTLRRMCLILGCCPQAVSTAAKAERTPSCQGEYHRRLRVCCHWRKYSVFHPQAMLCCRQAGGRRMQSRKSLSTSRSTGCRPTCSPCLRRLAGTTSRRRTAGRYSCACWTQRSWKVGSLIEKSGFQEIAQCQHVAAAKPKFVCKF